MDRATIIAINVGQPLGQGILIDPGTAFTQSNAYLRMLQVLHNWAHEASPDAHSIITHAEKRLSSQQDRRYNTLVDSEIAAIILGAGERGVETRNNMFRIKNGTTRDGSQLLHRAPIGHHACDPLSYVLLFLHWVDGWYYGMSMAYAAYGSSIVIDEDWNEVSTRRTAQPASSNSKGQRTEVTETQKENEEEDEENSWSKRRRT